MLEADEAHSRIDRDRRLVEATRDDDLAVDRHAHVVDRDVASGSRLAPAEDDGGQHPVHVVEPRAAVRARGIGASVTRADDELLLRRAQLVVLEERLGGFGGFEARLAATRRRLRERGRWRQAGSEGDDGRRDEPRGTP